MTEAYALRIQPKNPRTSTSCVRKSTTEVSVIRRTVARPKVLARIQRLQWGVGGRGRRGV